MGDDEEKVVMGEEGFVHMPYWRYYRDGVLLHGWQNRVPQDPQPGPFKKKGEGPSLPQGYPGKDPTCTSSHDRWSDKFRHSSEYMFEYSHPEILKDPCRAIFGNANPDNAPKDPECEEFCPTARNAEEEEKEAIEREKTERKIALFSKPLSRPPF